MPVLINQGRAVRSEIDTGWVLFSSGSIINIGDRIRVTIDIEQSHYEDTTRSFSLSLVRNTSASDVGAINSGGMTWNGGQFRNKAGQIVSPPPPVQWFVGPVPSEWVGLWFRMRFTPNAPMNYGYTVETLA